MLHIGIFEINFFQIFIFIFIAGIALIIAGRKSNNERIQKIGSKLSNIGLSIWFIPIIILFVVTIVALIVNAMK